MDNTELFNKLKKEISEAQERLNDITKILEYETSLLKEVERLGKGTWVILEDTYYQFGCFKNGFVVLYRLGIKKVFSFKMFNENFRIATEPEVAQHEQYLKNKFGVQFHNNVMCENRRVGYKIKEIHQGDRLAKMVLKSLAISLEDVISDNSNEWDVLQKSGLSYLYEECYGNTPIKPQTNKSFDPLNCEFYMVTCRGKKGAKFRHTSFEDAVAQARRVAQKENHPTWVVGVVQKIKP